MIVYLKKSNCFYFSNFSLETYIYNFRFTLFMNVVQLLCNPLSFFICIYIKFHLSLFITAWYGDLYCNLKFDWNNFTDKCTIYFKSIFFIQIVVFVIFLKFIYQLYILYIADKIEQTYLTFDWYNYLFYIDF